MQIIGVNSGTSVDSLDIAVFNVSKNKISFIVGQSFKYPTILSDEIRALGPNSSILQVDNISIKLGEFVGRKINNLLKSGKYKPGIIGMHGQTIHHANDIKNTTTIQITEADSVALLTKIDVAHDFRKKDVVSGGTAAPFVPILDHILFQSIKRPFIAQNLGGIANTTLVHKNFDKTIGYDSGPANSLIDKVIYKYSKGEHLYDKNGEFARKGKVYKPLLSKILSNNYFRRKPPKSTGNIEFGIQYVNDLLSYCSRKDLQIFDILATLTEVTVETIARSYEQFIFKNHKIRQVVLSGGGTKNKFLMGRLKRRLPMIDFLISDDSGMPSRFKECALFAYLAFLRVNKVEVNLKNITGSKYKVILGKISSN